MDYLEYLKSIGITEEEDFNTILSAERIEIRIVYEESDEHEGYYDTIDDAIEALNDLRKLYPHLNKGEKL